jgi:hypothetical protein
MAAEFIAEIARMHKRWDQLLQQYGIVGCPGPPGGAFDKFLNDRVRPQTGPQNASAKVSLTDDKR